MNISEYTELLTLAFKNNDLDGIINEEKAKKLYEFSNMSIYKMPLIRKYKRQQKM